MKKKVFIVGAGPGDSNLLTLKAVDVLKKAEVVLYDRLVSKEVLSLIPNNVKKIYVGRSVGDDYTHQESTNSLLLEWVQEKSRVVRLKGGDPFIFGRGGEEAEFLSDHNIDFEIIPGITSAIGTAVYAGIPLTHRDYASSVVIATGHEDAKKKKGRVEWKKLAQSTDTIVILMGLSQIQQICNELKQGGLKKNTPVAVIQEGTTRNQKTVFGDLHTISSRVKTSNIKPPCIIIVGEVVNLSQKLSRKSRGKKYC